MEHPSPQSPFAGRPVLCAVDASHEGETVASAGARVAALTEGPLVLLHVAERAGGLHGLERLGHADRQARDQHEGDALLRRRGGEVPVAATLELALGDPADEVLLAAEDLDPALVVMGSRGGGVLRSLLGSVTRDVAGKATRPSLIVPEGTADALDGGTVVCGVDDSQECEHAAEVAAALAAALRAELVLVAVVEGSYVAAPAAPAGLPVAPEPPELLDERKAVARDRAEQLAARLSEAADVRTTIDVGDPAVRLAVVAEELDASLIVVGGAHPSPLASALTGSVAPALIDDGARPVLLVP